MSNLTQRVLTAIVGASIVISAILYSEYTLLLLMLFISIMSLLEFYRLYEGNGVQPQKFFGILIAISIFISPLLNSLMQIPVNLVALVIFLPYVIFIRELYTHSEKPFTNIGVTLLGVIYLAVPLFIFYLYSFQGTGPDAYHPKNILGFFFILWSNDTGAYFVGRYFGKRKLFERISPKKTWEGFFGGLVVAFIVAFLVSTGYTNLTRIQWLVIALIIVVTGTLGDLVESMFKRSIHIKDSGSILPGHGGFLDRFDGLYISAPFVFVYLLLSGN